MTQRDVGKHVKRKISKTEFDKEECCSATSMTSSEWSADDEATPVKTGQPVRDLSDHYDSRSKKVEARGSSSAGSQAGLPDYSSSDSEVEEADDENSRSTGGSRSWMKRDCENDSWHSAVKTEEKEDVMDNACDGSALPLANHRIGRDRLSDGDAAATVAVISGEEGAARREAILHELGVEVSRAALDLTAATLCAQGSSNEEEAERRQGRVAELEKRFAGCRRRFVSALKIRQWSPSSVHELEDVVPGWGTNPFGHVPNVEETSSKVSYSSQTDEEPGLDRGKTLHSKGPRWRSRWSINGSSFPASDGAVVRPSRPGPLLPTPVLRQNQVLPELHHQRSRVLSNMTFSMNVIREEIREAQSQLRTFPARLAHSRSAERLRRTVAVLSVTLQNQEDSFTLLQQAHRADRPQDEAAGNLDAASQACHQSPPSMMMSSYRQFNARPPYRAPGLCAPPRFQGEVGPRGFGHGQGPQGNRSFERSFRPSPMFRPSYPQTSPCFVPEPGVQFSRTRHSYQTPDCLYFEQVKTGCWVRYK